VKLLKKTPPHTIRFSNRPIHPVFKSPPAVTMHSPSIPRSTNSFPVVFEATPDAPVAGGLFPFSLRSTGDRAGLTGSLIDTIHHVDINNEGPYHSVSLDRIATAVTTEAPFRIDLDPPSVPIVRNDTLGLKVKATRNEGNSGKIMVRFLWNPPGVSESVSIDISGDKSEIVYELNANNDAAIAEWKVCVLAEADTPQGPVLVSSSLVPLKIAEPYISMTLDMAATEPGKNTAIIAKNEVLHPFEGDATVALLGLPHGATAPATRFNKSSTELTFPITIAADAAIGKHSSVFCKVSVPGTGTGISRQVAMGGTLRIDALVTKPETAPAKTVAQDKAVSAKPHPASSTSRASQVKELPIPGLPDIHQVTIVDVELDPVECSHLERGISEVLAESRDGLLARLVQPEHQ
jgi:hypothetical protein